VDMTKPRVSESDWITDHSDLYWFCSLKIIVSKEPVRGLQH